MAECCAYSIYYVIQAKVTVNKICFYVGEILPGQFWLNLLSNVPQPGNAED